MTQYQKEQAIHILLVGYLGETHEPEDLIEAAKIIALMTPEELDAIRNEVSDK